MRQAQSFRDRAKKAIIDSQAIDDRRLTIHAARQRTIEALRDGRQVILLDVVSLERSIMEAERRAHKEAEGSPS